MKRPKLSININKIALIRNSRGGQLPDLLHMAMDLETYGAEGITVHPRPDQRHIRYTDIPILKKYISTELNIEGYPTPEFIHLVLDNNPAQVTLVPDPPGALTSDHGWDIQSHHSFLEPIIAEFKSQGIRVSLFVDAKPMNASLAKSVGADRIELYTGPYAEQFKSDALSAVTPHINTAVRAESEGIDINAGHDLNLDNLAWYTLSLPQLDEVSIGHAMICDALYYGYSNVVAMYLDRLVNPTHYEEYTNNI